MCLRASYEISVGLPHRPPPGKKGDKEVTQGQHRGAWSCICHSFATHRPPTGCVCHSSATHRPPTGRVCHSSATHLPLIGQQRPPSATHLPRICHSSATNGLPSATHLPLIGHPRPAICHSSAIHLPPIGHQRPQTKPKEISPKPRHTGNTMLTQKPFLDFCARQSFLRQKLRPRAFTCVRFRVRGSPRPFRALRPFYETRAGLHET